MTPRLTFHTACLLRSTKMLLTISRMSQATAAVDAATTSMQQTAMVNFSRVTAKVLGHQAARHRQRFKPAIPLFFLFSLAHFLLPGLVGVSHFEATERQTT